MNRYLLFGGKEKRGGWADLIGSFETTEIKIIRVINEEEEERLYTIEEVEMKWWQVVDSVTGETVKEYMPA